MKTSKSPLEVRSAVLGPLMQTDDFRVQSSYNVICDSSNVKFVTDSTLRVSSIANFIIGLVHQYIVMETCRTCVKRVKTKLCKNQTSAAKKYCLQPGKTVWRGGLHPPS